MSHIFGNDIDMFQDTAVISDALINIYELFALLLRMDSVKGFGVFWFLPMLQTPINH